MTRQPIRRINLFGGAGAGKSTMAAKLFADLKAFGYDIELINEYIKSWAHEKKFPKSWDQCYVFGHQMHKEDLVLHNNVKFIITDSPLLMNVSYSVYYGFEGCDELVSLADKFELKYPSLSFLLHRKYPFVTEGRYQTEEESILIDKHVKCMMEMHLDQSRTYFDNMNYEEILSTIKKEIG